TNAEYDELEEILNKSIKEGDPIIFEQKANEIIMKNVESKPIIQNSNDFLQSTPKLKLSEQSLRRAWDTSQRTTKEDWAEWMRKFSIELLRESPSPALRSCLYVIEYYPIVKSLFNAGFVSCWYELSEA